MNYIKLLNSTYFIKNKFSDFILRLFGGVSGLTIFNIVLIYDKDDIAMVLHELVHRNQISNEGLLKFIFKYCYYYITNWFEYCNHWNAYYNIPYEKEAYEYWDDNFKQIYYNWRVGYYD